LKKQEKETRKIKNFKPPKIYLKTISNNKEKKQERNIYFKKYRK